MKKVDDFISNFMYWFCIFSGIVMILGSLGMMLYTSLSMNKFFIIFPILSFIVVRKLLWTYIKGLFKFDDSNFPRFY